MKPDGPDPLALWTSSAFVDEARAWVAAKLALRAIRLTGAAERDFRYGPGS